MKHYRVKVFVSSFYKRGKFVPSFEMRFTVDASTRYSAYQQAFGVVSSLTTKAQPRYMTVELAPYSRHE